MIPDEVDPTEVPLSALFRFTGQTINFKILDQLTDSPSTPTSLAEDINVSRSTVSNQLSKLRKLGFVEYRKEGREHVYVISSELPSLQHELIMDLIEVDHTDPDDDPFENGSSKGLSEEIWQKIQSKQKERFQAKLGLLANLFSHPGLVKVGQKKKYLKDKINRINREIFELKNRKGQ